MSLIFSKRFRLNTDRILFFQNLIMLTKVWTFLFVCKVINARQNQLKNSGIPGDIFGLEDLLTIVSCHC